MDMTIKKAAAVLAVALAATSVSEEDMSAAYEAAQQDMREECFIDDEEDW